MKNRYTKAIITAVCTPVFIAASHAYAHADQATYDDLVHWVDWMAKKYGMGTVYVAVQDLPPGVYGASQGRTVIVNSDYVDDPGALYSALVNDVAHGFHPGQSCTATQVVAAHESAHVLDYVTGYSARYELAEALRNGLSGTVSGYSFKPDGSVDAGEALADATVAVECDNPTPAQLALYEMLTS